MGLQTSFLLLILPLYLSNFLSFHTLHNEIFLAQDFCETVQAGVVIFYMQDDNDVLYCGIENQTSAAYFPQHLSKFLSFHTLHNEIFLSKIAVKPCKLE